MKNTGYYTIAVFLGLLASSRPAHAYLDPGAGSYAIQMILAGIFGGFVAFRGVVHVGSAAIIRRDRLERRMNAQANPCKTRRL